MLKSIALLLLFGIILSELFKKLKLPGLLGMILAGVLIGPYMLNLVDPKLLSISSDLRKLALIIILIRAGLTLDIAALKKVGKSALLISFLPATIEMALVTFLAPILFNITYLEAAMMGAVIAAVSPAVVVPRMIKLIDSGHGKDKEVPQLIMAGSSVDDIFVIIIFTTLLSIYEQNAFTPSSILSLPLSIITGVLIGLIIGLVLKYILSKLNLSSSLNALSVLGVSILIVSLEPYISQFLPISTLLAVMTLSFFIKNDNIEFIKDLQYNFKKMWVSAEIFLFVLLGISIDVPYLLKAGPIAIFLILIALIFRIIGVNIALVSSNLNTKEKLFCSIAYLPKATVQAAIGAIPLSMGVNAGGLILTIAALTIIITAPIGALGIELTYEKLLKAPKLKENFSFRD